MTNTTGARPLTSAERAALRAHIQGRHTATVLSRSILSLLDENEELRKALREMEHLHLCDHDEHETNCEKDHGEMLLLNPEGCAACRVFARAALSEKTKEETK